MGTTTRTSQPKTAEGRPARATYRLLGIKGMSPAEAGNLTAWVNGLEPVEGGWRIGQIEQLLFLRHLVRVGRLES
jgi:hypothetical protein